ncbi:hypothetical protein E0K89_018480 [Aquicoccus sp. SCR17]|nr:hypothetical protein [Carideicomes alvinocaridis]
MRLNEISFDDSLPVDGYGPGFFRVAGEVHEGALCLAPTGRGGWGGYDDVETLLALKDRIDVLFIGTGADMAYLPRAFRERLEAEEMAIEAMATGPACRTYNVLLSEGRRVALAALPV